MADNCPLRFLLVTFAGWVNRHQAEAMDYLIEENRVLKEQLGKKRLRRTDIATGRRTHHGGQRRGRPAAPVAAGRGTDNPRQHERHRPARGDRGPLRRT